MSNLVSRPLQDNFETECAQQLTTAGLTLYVNDVGDFTFPAGVTTYAVINPKKSNQEVVTLSAKNGSANTFTISTRNIDQGNGVTTTAQTHAVGSKVIISDNYKFWADIATAINTKLDQDGGNSTTSYSLAVVGSNWRHRKDGSDMKFRDDNQAEVTLSALAAGAGVNDKVKVSVADTTASYLDVKLTAGAGLLKTITNPAGNEVLDVAVDLADTNIFVAVSGGAGDSGKLARLGASGTFPTGFIPTGTDTTKIALSNLAAKGDLISASAASTVSVLTVGANGTHLMPDSTQASGLRWVSALYNSDKSSRLQPAGNGTQTIAHGLTFAPKLVRFSFSGRWSIGGQEATVGGGGSWSTTDKGCSYFQLPDGASALATPFQSTNVMEIRDAGGTLRFTALVTVDATNISIAWTNTGGNASDGIYFNWEALC